MIQHVRGLSLCLAAIVLAACAVPKVDAPAPRLAAIRSIAVIVPPEPKGYTVMMMGHPGMAFGLIGGLMAAGDQSAKEARLAESWKGRRLEPFAILGRKVAEELARAGYDARVESAPWKDEGSKYTLAYESIASTADAALVITPTITGFVATGPTADYLPTMTAVVVLLGKDRKEQIYRGYHAYGWGPKAEGWRVSAAPKGFPDIDALTADPGASAAALQESGAAIAQTIREDLKRSGM